MRIQLPNETWMEILNWLRRRDLVDKLDNLWDRQFTPIIQGWLHKYTKNAKIGELAAKAGGGLHLNGLWKEVPIAQVEMPKNITSFKRITISQHPLEQEMMTFLHRMRPLFHNVCLNITDGHNENEVTTGRYQTAIRHLMLLINDDHDQPIESIVVDYQWLQFIADNFHDALFNAQLLSICYYDPDHSELLVNWLFTRREDGQARTLMFNYDQVQQIDEYCTRVRERFLNPTRQLACPFFIRIWTFLDEQLLIPPVTENVTTGEQLTVQEERHGHYIYCLITNCPMDADGEWLARKTAELLDLDDNNQQRTISLYFPFSIAVPSTGPLSLYQMMSSLKRMISNWWMTIYSTD